MSERSTVYVGNLSPKVDHDLLFELFTQGGPLESVKVITGDKGVCKGYAFVTFKHESSVDYSMKLFDKISLFGRPMVVNLSTQNRGRGNGTAVPSTASAIPSNSSDYRMNYPSRTLPSDMYHVPPPPQFLMNTPPPSLMHHSQYYQSSGGHFLQYGSYADNPSRYGGGAIKGGYAQNGRQDGYHGNYNDRYSQHPYHRQHDQYDNYGRHLRY